MPKWRGKMKTKINFSNLFKVIILIMLCLNFLAMAVHPVYANMSLPKFSDKDLVKMTTLAVKSNRWVDAAVYYSIYLDRKSNFYSPTDKWMDESQKNLKSIIYNAGLDQEIAAYIRTQKLMGSCAPATVGEYRESNANKPISESLLQIGPSPDEVWVFQDFDFGGEWVSLPMGNYFTASQIGLPDNSVSSLMVGNNVIAYLCTDANLQGNCGVFVPLPNYLNPTWNQHPNLTNNTIGNDSVTSIRVEQKNSCTPGTNEVTIFMHFDNQPPCQKLPLGTYGNPAAFGLPDNAISSIKLGSNVKANLCPDYNFGGNCEWFLANDSNLSDNTVGNDTLSSIIVEVKP
jgi:hypothetical protein